jgi:hypothetical protein
VVKTPRRSTSCSRKRPRPSDPRCGNRITILQVRDHFLHTARLKSP